MVRWTGWLAAGACGAVLAAAPLAAAAQGKDSPLNLRPDRAGWMMGMYLGEQKGQPYPFVLQVDPKSDARIKGVKPGDELIRFNGDPIHSLEITFHRAKDMRPGREVVLWMRRGVETLRFFVRVPKTPGPAPEESAAKPETKKDDEKSEDGDKKKKSKKKPPVVIKPIPAEDN